VDPEKADLGQGMLSALDRGFDIPAQTVADLPAPRPYETYELISRMCSDST
jgi:hypothetical protein